MVVTTYTGMPAEMMETDITNRLERWLSQASGLDHIESRSMIGVSILNCFFQPGFDPNNALAQISTLVMSDLHYLPPGTQPPIVMGYDPTANLPVALMTVFTPGLDEAQALGRVQLHRAQPAQRRAGRGRAGGLRRQVPPGHGVPRHRTSCRATGSRRWTWCDALSQRQRDDPDGRREDRDVRLQHHAATGWCPTSRASTTSRSRSSNGAPVFIRDIGQTEDASAVQTNVVQVNGVKQTYIPLFRRIGSSTLTVVANIRKAVPERPDRAARQQRARAASSTSRRRVRDAIFDVIRELVVGVLLAAIVIYLLPGQPDADVDRRPGHPAVDHRRHGRRFTIMGQSLNLMTLGGLALITGPLDRQGRRRAREHRAAPGAWASTLARPRRTAFPRSRCPSSMASLALIIVFFPVTFFQGLGKIPLHADGVCRSPSPRSSLISRS